MADSSGGPHPRVGLVYDENMCAHATPDGEDHHECPERLRAIWNKLHTAGVLDRCVILNAKKTNDIYVAINLVHSKKHVELIERVSDKAFSSKRQRIANKFNSIYLNKGSSEAAYLAAGSVLEAVKRVASGEFNSAFAVVRPPGHHAEEGEPMGFCLYNNVALATSYILNSRPDLGIAKILIVDWDVHHGNGTQKMFWKDSRVLFFSVHRHDNGTFYPGNDDGNYDMIGEGSGIGYNINVPWEDGGCGDADYLAVWDNVLIPVAKEFNPDLVIVSAGFDAAIHDPLGGCRVTPYGYSMLLRKLMDFADGKIVLALEGGYNLQSLANSVLACVQVLLDGKPISGSVEECAFKSTWRTIEAVRQVFKGYWPSLGKELVKNMETQTTAADQIKYLYYTGETYNARINICSRIAYFREINYKLPRVDWDYILNGPFGKVIRILQQVSFSPQTIHAVLIKQLETKKTWESWYEVGGREVRFSMKEFKLITGLNCGSDVIVYGKKQKGGKEAMNRFFGKPSITIKDLFDEFKNYKELDCKKFMLALLLIVEGILLGGDKKRQVNPYHVKLLENMDLFWKYPWGRVAYMELHNALTTSLSRRMQTATSSESNRRVPYSLQGMPVVFQIWCWEAAPDIGMQFCDHYVNDVYPRGIRWFSDEAPERGILEQSFGDERIVVNPVLCPNAEEQSLLFDCYFEDEKSDPHFDKVVKDSISKGEYRPSGKKVCSEG